MPEYPIEHFGSRLPALVNLFVPCVAFALLGHTFYRNQRDRVSQALRRHEAVHVRQQAEQGLVRFFRNYKANEAEARAAEH